MSRDDAMDKFIEIGTRVLIENGFEWATVNTQLPGPDYYQGCERFSNQDLVSMNPEEILPSVKKSARIVSWAIFIGINMILLSSV